MYACRYFIPVLNTGNYLLISGFIISCPHFNNLNKLLTLWCYRGILLKAYFPHSTVGAWRLRSGAFHRLGVFPDLCRAEEAESVDQPSKDKPVRPEGGHRGRSGEGARAQVGGCLCCTCSSRTFLWSSGASYLHPFPPRSREFKEDNLVFPWKLSLATRPSTAPSLANPPNTFSDRFWM